MEARLNNINFFILFLFLNCMNILLIQKEEGFSLEKKPFKQM